MFPRKQLAEFYRTSIEFQARKVASKATTPTTNAPDVPPSSDSDASLLAVELPCTKPVLAVPEMPPGVSSVVAEGGLNTVVFSTTIAVVRLTDSLEDVRLG